MIRATASLFTDSVMGAWSYQYDSLNRVVGGANASGGPNPRYSDCFGYDNWGNRTNEAYSATACGSSPAPTTWATYSTANRITGTGLMPAGFTYDAAGNVLDDGANEYAYDNEERVCAAQSLTTGIIAGYIYDASGTRVAKGTIASLSCALTGFTLTASYALGPNGEEVSEFNSSNTWQYSNVYAGDKLFATYLNSPSEVDFTLYDWLGTKRVTVHPNGSMATCSSSLAFGNNLTPCGGTGSDPSNLHFTGKERDTGSGNDYFGARYYASNMGRWISPDWSAQEVPVPYAKLDNPQSLNLYSYVGNNPLSGIDADGHIDCSGSNASGVGCVLLASWDAQHGINSQIRSDVAAQQNATSTNPTLVMVPQGAIPPSVKVNGTRGREVDYAVFDLNKDGSLGFQRQGHSTRLHEEFIYGSKTGAGICNGGAGTCTQVGIHEDLQSVKAGGNNSYAVTRTWFIDGKSAPVWNPNTQKPVANERLYLQFDTEFRMEYPK
jgi:RHS repeat-associated protein